MFQGTRIVGAVPTIGRLTYLGVQTSTAGNACSVPTAARAGDLVFMYSGGFDAGVTTNPGVVGTPSNLFTDSASLAKAFDGLPGSYKNPILLCSVNDGVNGSDEGEAYLGVANFLESGTAVGPTYNGASGENTYMFGLGLRNASGESIGKKLTVIRHISSAATHNTSAVSVNEKTIPQEASSVGGLRTTGWLWDHTMKQNQLGIVLVIYGNTSANMSGGSGTTRRLDLTTDTVISTGVSANPGSPISSVPESPIFRANTGGFDGSFTVTSGSSITAIISYEVAYPGKKFNQYYYTIDTNGYNSAFVAISRMIVEVS